MTKFVCLNPCCNGMLLKANILKIIGSLKLVLILVVMECF